MSTTPTNPVALLRSIAAVAQGETHVEYLHTVDVLSDWQSAILAEWQQRAGYPLPPVPGESAELLFDMMAPGHPVFAKSVQASTRSLLWHMIARVQFHASKHATPVPTLTVPEPN